MSIHAFLLYVALPTATLLIGAILGAFLTLGVGRKDAYTVDDDRSFEDQWRDEIAERPATYPAGMETDVVQAVRLSDGRPKPGPNLSVVRDA